MVSKAKPNWSQYYYHSRHEKVCKNYYKQFYTSRLGNVNIVGKAAGGQSLLKKKQTEEYQIT